MSGYAPTPTAAKQDAQTGILSRILLNIRDKLVIGFLPRGYPHSVTPDYTPYTVYQFLHSVTGTLTGTLSTQALLQALGLGAGAAVGLAATTNWIIKDGFGLLGGVIYAGWMGNRFDSSPKRYRFIASLSIQAATFAELLTPLMPHLFLPMASLSNIGKNIGWLASSATKASMHKGFLREDNLGDVTAKAGAQGTAAGVVGTALGVGLSYVAGTDPMTLFGLFVPLTAANLWWAYKANGAVVTRTVNLERGELLLREYVRVVVDGKVGRKGAPSSSLTPASWNDGAPSPFLPPPERVSDEEQFIFPYHSIFSVPLALEPYMAPCLPSLPPTRVSEFLSGNSLGPGGSGEHYRLLVVKKRPKSRLGLKKGDPVWTVCLWFLQDAKSEDILKGFYHSCVLRDMIERRPISSVEEGMERVQEGYAIVGETVGELMSSMEEKEWDVDHTYLGYRNARIVVGLAA
ncbi:hypothetical protein HK104_001570 [Borealophlyctis nickersoniae]|nr:hypothetical protein HK104_001570 [Borealophlyctis nickersoniae]